MLNIESFLNHSCFAIGNSLIPENPYRRPVRNWDAKAINFERPITGQEVYTNKNLLLNQILLAIYEQDLLFLDEEFLREEAQLDFKKFYDPFFVSQGKLLRPQLESLAFDFLNKEIEVISHWSKKNLLNYVFDILQQYDEEKSALIASITNAVNSEVAAKMLLIQMAPDFLSEASAMARTLPGSFGLEQSELMKIFIDEYGYGIHHAKHSTLFLTMLNSVNMQSKIHHYYNSYLPTSLMLVNYFHYLSSNKANWFKYLGALYYAEATIPHFNRQIDALLKKIFLNVDTQYFREHIHIDGHHRKMVLENLVMSSVERYGEAIICDILHGFESFRMLQKMADEDLIQQIIFNNQLFNKESLPRHFILGVTKDFKGAKGEIVSGHIHAQNELFSVLEGSVAFYVNGIEPFILKAGDSLFIPAGRLHATDILTTKAHYQVQHADSAAI